MPGGERFRLPIAEDTASIQLAINQVIRALVSRITSTPRKPAYSCTRSSYARTNLLYDREVFAIHLQPEQKETEAASIPGENPAGKTWRPTLPRPSPKKSTSHSSNKPHQIPRVYHRSPPVNQHDCLKQKSIRPLGGHNKRRIAHRPGTEPPFTMRPMRRLFALLFPPLLTALSHSPSSRRRLPRRSPIRKHW